jgi:hypothetical protein
VGLGLGVAAGAATGITATQRAIARHPKPEILIHLPPEAAWRDADGNTACFCAFGNLNDLIGLRSVALFPNDSTGAACYRLGAMSAPGAGE